MPPPTRPPRCVALVIGIRYAQHRQLALHGTIPDARRVAHYLRSRGVRAMRVVTDASGVPRDKHPTRARILVQLRWLVATARARRARFVWFSYAGHGTQAVDTSGDEADGRDEQLLAADRQRVTDDELHELLVRPLHAAGIALRGLIDCCHAGTALDLAPSASVSLTSGPSIAVICACTDRQYAHEDEHGGYATTWFLEALKRMPHARPIAILAFLRIRARMKRVPQRALLQTHRNACAWHPMLPARVFPLPA